MSHIAKQLGEDPAVFKHRHFLKSDSTSLTGAKIFGDLVLDEMLERILSLSDYNTKVALNAFQPDINEQCLGSGKRKGIGLAVFQHGCGFAGDLEDTLVRARVRVIKLADGTVQILASNTDIGQGLSLTFRKIVADTLNRPLDTIQLAVPDTGIVPDSGPTVASRSILIVGYLLEKAAQKLQLNWQEGEQQEIEEVYRKPDYHVWDQSTYQAMPIRRSVTA